MVSFVVKVKQQCFMSMAAEKCSVDVNDEADARLRKQALPAKRLSAIERNAHCTISFNDVHDALHYYPCSQNPCLHATWSFWSGDFRRQHRRRRRRIVGHVRFRWPIVRPEAERFGWSTCENGKSCVHDTCTRRCRIQVVRSGVWSTHKFNNNRQREREKEYDDDGGTLNNVYTQRCRPCTCWPPGMP